MSRIYGQHGFARWFERHFYDWFHDPEETYAVISENTSPTTATGEHNADGIGQTAALKDAGGVETASAAQQKVLQEAEQPLLVHYGIRPPSPPAQPKLSMWKKPSSSLAGASAGVPIQETEAKHSKLLSSSSPEAVSPASDAAD